MFEVEPEVVGAGGGRISPYWQVGAGTDTMYSSWNPTSVAEDLMVTIYYDQQGDTYLAPLHLGPNASSGISIMELMEKAQPNAQGHVIPMNARAGVMQVRSPGSDLRNLVTVVVGGGIYNPVAGTCQNPCIVCPGATGSEILPSSFSIPAGTSESFQFLVIENNGSTENYSESATWEGSSSVLSVQPQLATGLEAGSAGISANMSSGVPEYSASFCAGTLCPSGGQGASISGAVTPVLTSITPTMGLATSEVTVTIVGVGFATPVALVVANGVTAQVQSSTPTRIVAQAQVPNETPQNIQVQANGQTSNAVSFTGQLPRRLLRYNYPGAPSGIGPLTALTDGSVVNLGGTTLLTGQCGVYRNYAYEIADKNGNAIESPDAIEFWETFSDYSGPSTLPQPESSSQTFNGVEADIQYFGKAYPSCPGSNSNESFTQNFYLYWNNIAYVLSTTINISRGYFNGTPEVNETITIP